MSGEALREKLWEVLRGLANCRTFIYSTDHLSDVELYTHLWETILNEPAHELDDRMGDCACHVDLLGDGSDTSNWLHFRYYANDRDRKDWMEFFPDETLPERIDPPYDRDRHLPKRTSWGKGVQESIGPQQRHC